MINCFFVAYGGKWLLSEGPTPNVVALRIDLNLPDRIAIDLY